MKRRVSKKIKIGNTYIGGDSDILVQSMLNIPASDIDGSVAQAKELASAGCQVIRFAIPNEDALALIEPIKNAVDVPLVADIHFDYKLALGAAERGIDKIRINPGNIGDDSRVKAVADICKLKNIPIRIGVNSGSLEKEILARYGVPPESIVLEITETAASYEHNIMDENIKLLTDAGFDFSLDDFGTGYSNMSRIADLPFKIGKLDKIFTRTGENEKLDLVTESSVHMMKAMNMKIVVEGVETREMLDRFTSLGCDYIQGYYFSRPLPEDEFVKFILENQMVS